jgi:hypothetical protein
MLFSQSSSSVLRIQKIHCLKHRRVNPPPLRHLTVATLNKDLRNFERRSFLDSWADLGEVIEQKNEI